MKKNKAKRSAALEIRLYDKAGSFAENKDIAKNLRKNKILPTLKDGKQLVLNYSKVSSTTQSFTHALISEAIRKFGIEVLDRIFFKSCNESVKKVIRIVVRYMQKKLG